MTQLVHHDSDERAIGNGTLVCSGPHPDTDDRPLAFFPFIQAVEFRGRVTGAPGQDPQHDTGDFELIAQEPDECSGSPLNPAAIVVTKPFVDFVQAPGMGIGARRQRNLCDRV